MPTIYLWDNNRRYKGNKDFPNGVTPRNGTPVEPVGIANPIWYGPGAGWVEYVPPSTNYLSVTADKEVYAVNETITLNIDLTSEGVPIPLTATYYAPVMRTSDSKQIEFLQIDLIDGSDIITFSIAEKGQYTLIMDKVTPKPTSKLSEDILIIVI